MWPYEPTLNREPLGPAYGVRDDAGLFVEVAEFDEPGRRAPDGLRIDGVAGGGRDAAHGLGVAATVAGLSIDASLTDWRALPAHLTLTHAWGLATSSAFNHPSWSISAEWFAYLCFPLFAASLCIVLLLEWLVLRRIPSISHWLGLQLPATPAGAR